MIVGRFVIYVVIHFISNAVIADIGKNIDVVSADAFIDSSFCFAASETVKTVFYLVAVLDIAVKCGIVFRHFVKIVAKLRDIMIYAVTQLFC